MWPDELIVDHQFVPLGCQDSRNRLVPLRSSSILVGQATTRPVIVDEFRVCGASRPDCIEMRKPARSSLSALSPPLLHNFTPSNPHSFIHRLSSPLAYSLDDSSAFARSRESSIVLLPYCRTALSSIAWPGRGPEWQESYSSEPSHPKAVPLSGLLDSSSVT